MRDRVLEAIRAGDVSMRPRWHFVLRAMLAGIGAAIIALALLYVASFIVFALRQSGVWFVPVFGSRGWFEFIFSLPWALVALTGAFVIVLEVLVRRYSFGYRRPLLVSAALIILLVTVGAIFVEEGTPLHRNLLRSAEEGRLPLGGDFYRGFGTPRLHNVHVGTVASIDEGGFSMETRRGDALSVATSSDTVFPEGVGLSVGDTVVVFGERTVDSVIARGIRKVDRDFGPHGPIRGRPGAPFPPMRGFPAPAL